MATGGALARRRQDDPFRASDQVFADELGIRLNAWRGGHVRAYWRRHYRDYLRFYARALARCDRPTASVRPVTVEPAAAVTCHVTHPNGRTPPGEGASPGFHGRRGLWTALPPDGVLRITSTTPVPPGATAGEIHPDGSLTTKFPWFGSRAARPRLVIRGRRLDGPARRFRWTFGPGSEARSPHFWATRLTFARPGCWRVTGRSGRARLRFTVEVQAAAASRARSARSHAPGRRTPAAPGR